MERRPFGSSGLSVHPVCLGCASLGDMPDTFAYEVPGQRAIETVRAIFDSEINFLDTAAIYGYDGRSRPDGFGESERRVGAAIREHGGLPEGFVIATKADRDPTTNRFDGDQTRRSVEGSLERLGLDHLHVVYLHDPEYCSWEEITGKGGAIDVLRGYRDQGVIGCLGLAGGPIPEMLRYWELGGWDCVISHNRYTLLERSAEPLIRVVHAAGAAMVNAAPYGSGMLAKGPERYARYMYRDAPREMVDRARALDQACRRRNVPLAAAALQFSLRDPRISSTIVGMTRPERVAQTLELARTPLPDDLWQELDRVAGFA